MTTEKTTIQFTRRALKQTRVALHRQLVADNAIDWLNFLTQQLAASFNGASVVVLERLGGYYISKKQHVFSVDVHAASSRHNEFTEWPRPQPVVVKLGLTAELAQEIEGWTNIADGTHGTDCILLPVHSCEDAVGPDGASWSVMRYMHAESFTGEVDTMTLEQAVVDSVRFGSPTIGSVRNVVDDVLEKLREKFYVFAGERPLLLTRSQLNSFPKYVPAEAESWPRWEQAREQWKTNKTIGEARESVSRWLRLKTPTATPDAPFAEFDRISKLFENSDSPAVLIPSVHVGRAHGDLHGRNVLVGEQQHNQVGFPSVFDWEHAGDNNLIGWDLIKLEVELKIRCLVALFDRDAENEFLARCWDIESDLNRLTRELSQQSNWQNFYNGEQLDDGCNRYLRIMLTIRQQAEAILSGEQQYWWDEYRLLMRLYLYLTARFNYPYQQRQISILLLHQLTDASTEGHHE